MSLYRIKNDGFVVAVDTFGAAPLSLSVLLLSWEAKSRRGHSEHATVESFY